MAHPRSFYLAAVVLIAAAAWAVYARALDAPFVFDDHTSTTDNSSIVRLWPLVGDADQRGPLNPAKDLPSSGRPMVNLTLAINYYFGRLNPVGYRIFNVTVHLLSALLLMAIVQRVLCLDYFQGRFTGASPVAAGLAFIVALLWAVHPLQTETVVYVTQRTELLVGFFYLATLYASLRYWQAVSAIGRSTWLVLATLACLAGAASKEVMVTAPVMMLLFERTFISGSFRQALRKSWQLYIGLAASWALLAWLNYSAPRSNSAGFHLGVALFAWWLTQTKILLMYLKLVFWPWPLSIHYQVPQIQTLGAGWPWLLPVALLVVATLALLWCRSAGGFVGAWVLLILSPSSIVPITTEIAAERRMYLPSAALIALAVVGGYWVAKLIWNDAAAANGEAPRRPPDLLLIIVGLILALPLSLVSAHRLADYQDPITLWQEVLASYPIDPIAHNNLGTVLLDAGRTQEATQQYQTALEQRPDFPVAELNLGIALDRAQRLPEAISQYQRVLDLKPDFAEAEYHLAVSLDSTGRTPEALQHYELALRLKHDYPEVYNSFGATLSNAGRSEEAIQQLEQAIRLRPDYADAHNNLGIALARAGRVQEGIEQFNIALKLKADYPAAHLNLGAALGKAGRLQEAIAQLQEAARLQPDSIDAYANLAKAYVVLEQPDHALAAAEKALDLARSSNQTAVAQRIEAWLTEYRAQLAAPQKSSVSPDGDQPAPAK